MGSFGDQRPRGESGRNGDRSACMVKCSLSFSGGQTNLSLFLTIFDSRRRFSQKKFLLDLSIFGSLVNSLSASFVKVIFQLLPELPHF